jgi:hypothetical protein
MSVLCTIFFASLFQLSDFTHQSEHMLKSTSLPPEMVIRGEVMRSMTSHSDTQSTGTNSPSDRLLGARSEGQFQ